MCEIVPTEIEAPILLSESLRMVAAAALNATGIRWYGFQLINIPPVGNSYFLNVWLSGKIDERPKVFLFGISNCGTTGVAARYEFNNI